jgi:hypothetical protein
MALQRHLVADAGDDVLKNKTAVTAAFHADDLIILQTVKSGIGGRHVHVPSGDDAALFQFYRTIRADQRYRCRTGNITGRTDRRVHAKLKAVSTGNFDLRRPAQRAEYADFVDLPFFPCHLDGLCTGMLTRLHEVFYLDQFVTAPEEFLEIGGTEMYMAVGDIGNNRFFCSFSTSIHDDIPFRSGSPSIERGEHSFFNTRLWSVNRTTF